ncbi:hypothetical protein BD408DRAFT_414740 [Parasitella parasitica]|nr:hypothetical protein BD408DRAFT_414740 [Parasitella parasitica]
MQSLLHLCEEHSHRLDYRWSPSKCVIVAPTVDEQPYTLYNTPLPREACFSYLVIPIKPGGYVDISALVNSNTMKARKAMNQIAAICVNSKGFNRLLSVRFYVQMICS